MSDEERLPGLPLETQPSFNPSRRPLFERHGIHPVWFGILCLVAVFFLYQVIGGVASYFIVGAKPTAENVFAFRAATGVSQILLILVPVFFFVRLVTLNPREYLRVRLPDPRAFLAPLVGIFSLQQVLQIYLTFQEKIPIPHAWESKIKEFKDLIEEAYGVLVNSNSIPELILVLTAVALIPAVAEEFLFRGLVQRSFEKGLTPRKGIILTGIIFGLYHLNPFALFPLAALGIYLGFLAQRAESIWVSVAAHFYNNAAACIAVYIHQNDDAIITGDPHQMSSLVLIGQAVLFGIIFLLSNYYFMRVTRKPTPEPISL